MLPYDINLLLWQQRFLHIGYHVYRYEGNFPNHKNFLLPGMATLVMCSTPPLLRKKLHYLYKDNFAP